MIPGCAGPSQHFHRYAQPLGYSPVGFVPNGQSLLGVNVPLEVKPPEAHPLHCAREENNVFIGAESVLGLQACASTETGNYHCHIYFRV